MGDPLAIAAIALAGLLASGFDIARRRIPNWLTATVLAAGLLTRAATGSLMSGVAGALGGFGLFIAPWSWGWVGGGDVKLLAAFGAWLGWEGAVRAALLGCALAAPWAGVALWRRGRAAWLWQGPYLAAVAILSRQGGSALRQLALADPVPTLPLGPFLSAGAVAASLLAQP